MTSQLLASLAVAAEWTTGIFVVAMLIVLTARKGKK